MSHRPLLYRRGALLLVILTLGVALVSPGATRADEPSHYFPETGHTVSGLFLTYWESHGGLAQQGYPISDPFVEPSDLDPGKSYEVQYFERAVFERHPENAGTPYEVLLTQLGTYRYQARYGSAGAPGLVPNQAPGNSHLFTETNHWVGGKFWTYWQSHGGLAQQGYPLSDEFTELSDLDPGKSYKVQYFERAVFELHPENAGTPYEVLLAQLGTYHWKDKHGGAAPTVTPGPSTAPAAPALVSPPNDKVFRNYPRTATLTWNPISYPGGVTYGIEIEYNNGAWTSFKNQTGITGTSYAMPPLVGDNPARWRVWATGTNGVEGPKSAWGTFSFKTSASQYAGTWVNDDANTGGVAKFWITNSGQTLTIHWFGACGGGLCDNGAKNQAYNGEPFTILFNPPGYPTNEFTITLNNDAGTQLKAVDVSSAGGTNTYTFHRLHAADYGGTWVNNDPNTSGVLKLVITSNAETLNVHWYGACTPTPCDNGSHSAAYNGEPFGIDVSTPGYPTHQFTITFDNKNLTQLKVHDVGSASGTNDYYFHK